MTNREFFGHALDVNMCMCCWPIGVSLKYFPCGTFVAKLIMKGCFLMLLVVVQLST